MRRLLKRAKSISLILILVLLWQYNGINLSAQTRAAKSQQEAAAARNAPLPKAPTDSRFDSLLTELKEVIKRDGAKTKAAPQNGFAGIQKLTELKQKLVAENEKNQQYFTQLSEALKQKGISAEILHRQDEFVQKYNARYATLMSNLEDIESAHQTATSVWSKLMGQSMSVNWDETIDKTLSFLQESTPQPRRSNFDPHNLPHRSLKADKAIPPKLTREEWFRAFPKESLEESATSVKPSAAKSQTVAPSSSATVPPTDADLAETIEVQFTPEIRQLAGSLGKNPVKIYNWVRNNIEFTPTWGSIQGAQLCMETQNCNAFDTASLLVALLRVSGIPARYQMGTVEIPVEKFKNWAGGFTNTDAAASLFASGGIPSVVRRTDQSGNVATVKMEHVWVKAFVDYTPSGGSVNIHGNTWAEMDASFKQYRISNPPQDLTAALPFNRDAYLTSSTTGSPVEFYRQTLAAYVQQNYPGKTLDDFLIKAVVKVYEPQVLGGTLPFHLLIKGVDFANIPDALRQQVTFEVSSAGNSSPGLSYTAFLPQLLHKRITLSFMPASAADTQTATSFDGFYSTPPYLMSVKPVLRVAGAVVASGDPTGLGQTVNVAFKFALADGNQRLVENQIDAGTYNLILLAPENINDKTAVQLDSGFTTADDRFGIQNVDNSDRDEFVGGGLMTLASYYFNRLDNARTSMKQIFPVGDVKKVFEGIVAADVTVSTLFGAPAELSHKSMSMDVDLVEDTSIARDGAAGTATAYEKLRGLESSYWEHAVFEVPGRSKKHPAISTVSALKQATASGVQIFKVNASNLAAIEPQLQVSDEVKQAVEDGVNAGLEITIPATNLQLGEWRGVGYIVEDPLTGAGAYEISGGLSGSVLFARAPGLLITVNGQTFNQSKPTVFIAVATYPPINIPSLRSYLGLRIKQSSVNRDSVYESVAGNFLHAGYNVAVQNVHVEDYDKLVAVANHTDDDIYIFLGYGSDDGEGFCLGELTGTMTFKCNYSGVDFGGFYSGRIRVYAGGSLFGHCPTLPLYQVANFDFPPLGCTPYSDEELFRGNYHKAILGYSDRTDIKGRLEDLESFSTLITSHNPVSISWTGEKTTIYGDLTTTIP